jgi:hypothetical protein
MRTAIGASSSRPSLDLKQAEQFEDDDDNDNDSDNVEDISIHGSWITRRYPRQQAILPAHREPKRNQLEQIKKFTTIVAFRYQR